jgi:hypothetical protein
LGEGIQAMDIKQRLRDAIIFIPADQTMENICRDALAEIEQLEKYKAEAVRLARWCNDTLPGASAIEKANMICDVILDDVPDTYVPPEWD